MRITKIEIQGREGYTALLNVDDGIGYVTLNITTPDGPRFKVAKAGDRQDLWHAAVYLQQTLDGRKGGDRDVRRCFSPLKLISDL